MSNLKLFSLIFLVGAVVIGGSIFYYSKYKSFFVKDKIIFNTILSEIANNKVEMIGGIDIEPIEMLSEEIEFKMASSTLKNIE